LRPVGRPPPARHLIVFCAPAAVVHRDNVMEGRTASTKVRHQALVGSLSEGQPIPAVHNKKRSTIMCDYSLHHVATRPAKIDDRLVTTKFHNTSPAALPRFPIRA
jgi:hypothetical protein